jgi:hypothetical protein
LVDSLNLPKSLPQQFHLPPPHEMDLVDVFEAC